MWSRIYNLVCSSSICQCPILPTSTTAKQETLPPLERAIISIIWRWQIKPSASCEQRWNSPAHGNTPPSWSPQITGGGQTFGGAGSFGPLQIQITSEWTTGYRLFLGWRGRLRT